jgi:hypothetical protein
MQLTIQLWQLSTQIRSFKSTKMNVWFRPKPPCRFRELALTVLITGDVRRAERRQFHSRHAIAEATLSPKRGSLRKPGQLVSYQDFNPSPTILRSFDIVRPRAAELLNLE